MKRALISLLVLVVAIAWWATRQHTPPPETAVRSADSGAYPADFDERLRRVSLIKLERHADIPGDLIWQTAGNQPPVGNPAATKGGRVCLSNAGPFPAHFLRFGGSVQFFHQNLYAATEIPLLAKHPVTREITAGIAEAWAVCGNTIFLRLNPGARYNNGRPVRAGDFLLAVLLQAEQRCPEYETLAAAVQTMRAHGDYTLSLTLHKSADMIETLTLLAPAEPAFYADFNSRFREEYAQKIPPGTGPYRVGHVQRGRKITLQRVQDWWGEQLPLCRHRFNADIIEHHFLTSEAQVWEFFLQGKLDALQTRNIAAWQERLASHPELPTLVYDAEYPLPPYGIAINTRTVPDAELRRGLLHSMDMDTAVAQMTRGEGQRLTTFHSGYGKLSPETTPQYDYNPIAARSCFAKAGYTIPGADGILQRPDGTRLSVRLLYSPHEKISAMLATLINTAKSCGAEIVPEPVPWQTCQRQLQERTHQLVFWAVPAPSLPAPALFFAADAAPEYSPFALQSQEMDAALRSGNLARIDKQVYELAIWLPGWKENRVYLAHHHRLAVPPSPWCFDALDAHMFWVIPDKS